MEQNLNTEQSPKAKTKFSLKTGILLIDKVLGTNEKGVTDKYSWKFMRTTWLLTGLFLGVSLFIDNNETCQNILNQIFGMHTDDLHSITLPLWIIVSGMMFALWTEMGKIVAICYSSTAIWAYVKIVEANKRVMMFMNAHAADAICGDGLSILGNNWFIIMMAIAHILFCAGVLIQGLLGKRLYSRKLLVTIIIILLSVIGLRINGWVNENLVLIATIFLLPVMFRCRFFYRITRPLPVKVLLIVIPIVSLVFFKNQAIDIADLVHIIALEAALVLCVAIIRAIPAIIQAIPVVIRNIPKMIRFCVKGIKAI